MNVKNNYVFLVIFFFTNFTNSFSTLKFFTEDDIKTIRHYAKHSYIVAQQYYDWKHLGARLEANGPVAGENVYTIKGKTGHSFLENEHVVGSIYKNNNNVYISFHGSYFLSDWATDFWAFTSNAQVHGFSGTVHKGFSDSLLSSYDSMIRQLKLVTNNTNINSLNFIFTGHSLGAAVATIAARQFSALNGEIRSNNIIVEKIIPNTFDRSLIKLVTFSSPPLGDSIFADSFPQHVPLSLRFYHSYDIVHGLDNILSNINPSIGKHVGYPIEILLFEPTASLLTTYPGLNTLRDTFKSSIKENIIGRNAHRISDILTIIPKIGKQSKLLSKPLAYSVDALSRIGPSIIVLMHLIPEEEVILRAFNYERIRMNDDNYRGASWWDYTRNAFLYKFYEKFFVQQ